VDIVFVMDILDTVTDRDLQQTIALLTNLTSTLDVDTDRVRIGLLSYNTFLFHLNSYTSKNDVIAAITKTKRPSPDLDFAETLRFLRTVMFSSINGDRKNVRNVAVVVSNGMQNLRRSEVRSEIEMAKRAGIQVVSVGINVLDTENFGQLTANTNNRILVSNFNQLPSQIEKLRTRVCSGMIYIHFCVACIHHLPENKICLLEFIMTYQ